MRSTACGFSCSSPQCSFLGGDEGFRILLEFDPSVVSLKALLKPSFACCSSARARAAIASGARGSSAMFLAKRSASGQRSASSPARCPKVATPTSRLSLRASVPRRGLPSPARAGPRSARAPFRDRRGIAARSRRCGRALRSQTRIAPIEGRSRRARAPRESLRVANRAHDGASLLRPPRDATPAAQTVPISAARSPAVQAAVARRSAVAPEARMFQGSAAEESWVSRTTAGSGDLLGKGCWFTC